MSYCLVKIQPFLNISKYLVQFNTYKTTINNGSFINGTSATYLENLYTQWQVSPEAVDSSWDHYFRSLEVGQLTSTEEKVDENTVKEYLELQSIIQSFRMRGHMAATLDPLGIVRGEHLKYQILQQHVLRHYKVPSDKTKKYMLHNTDYIGGGEKHLTLNEILIRLEKAYCGNIGIEYMYIGNQDKLDFIRKKFETPGAIKSMSHHEKRLILRRLIRANEFEEFLSKKYPSEKRFGLEGGEVLIPALNTMIDVASSIGVEKINIGIAHRGRLNVLANVVRKPLNDIFAQFRTIETDDQGSGDVKYHLGTYVERISSQTKRPITVRLAANPSHLESVDPIILGMTHCESIMLGEGGENKVWSILIHGDAATSGQGIVYETFHLSELPCFTNHGSIHIIINNQIGFTTDPRMARSSEYCTEVAKVSSAPVFHVNGDDPESVYYVMKVATEYKYLFNSDVVIDIVCYRRHGHSEADQPKFTHPLMYKIIKNTKPVALKYTEQLLSEKVISEEDVSSMKEFVTKWLQEGFESAQKVTIVHKSDWLCCPWKGFFKPEKNLLSIPNTGSSREVLLKIGEAVSTAPPNFDLHPGLIRILKARKEMIEENSVDWALGEAFAIGSLVNDKINVRLTGQDVERGTFSHRHHVYHHQSQDKITFEPLKDLFPDGGYYTICNSSLSEFGVLGFQTGYSVVDPYNLIIWEAQFGDFCNSAQIIIDQFLSSGETKWGSQCGIVLLLPHGLEGQGPEHSSARPERFLQLCAEIGDVNLDMPQRMLSANWFVANVTTPANLFHILRRQIKLNYRKPLVLFTPKSILRHPKAKSSIDEMIDGTEFKPFIKDETISNVDVVERILICSGKVFYELAEEREKRNLESKIAICRIEQLFPFPYEEVRKYLEQYPQNVQICWAQEEHRNQGCWGFMRTRLTRLAGRDIMYCGRHAAASPSTGSKVQHIKEHEDFMKQCFT